jgi:hypothetical protein
MLFDTETLVEMSLFEIGPNARLKPFQAFSERINEVLSRFQLVIKDNKGGVRISAFFRPL